MAFFQKKEKCSEVKFPQLRIASTYYTPEGRYFNADAVLKAKKRSLFYPICLGLALAGICFTVSTTALKPNSSFFASARAVMTSSQETPVNNIDYGTTSSIQKKMSAHDNESDIKNDDSFFW